MVAPGRFELPSQDPESRMIDRYTTGLASSQKCYPFLILSLWKPVDSVRLDGDDFHCAFIAFTMRWYIAPMSPSPLIRFKIPFFA